MNMMYNILYTTLDSNRWSTEKADVACSQTKDMFGMNRDHALLMKTLGLLMFNEYLGRIIS